MRWRLTAEINAPSGRQTLVAEDTQDGLARSIFALFGNEDVSIDMLSLVPVDSDGPELSMGILNMTFDDLTER